MNNLSIFLYEGRHLLRSPFKILALCLFALAGLYGLHNGAALYAKQLAEIAQLTEKAAEQKQKIIGYYQQGEKGPEDRPWIDVTTPFWAVWNTPTYYFKTPSPGMIYAIGQAEQYGFYKQITVWSSVFDADMAEEIANPERLQAGALDFAFAAIFLSPLLLLVLLYDVRGMETDQQLLALIFVQVASPFQWLMARTAFYAFVVWGVLTALVLYGASLVPVTANTGIGVLVLLSVYLLFWWLLYAWLLHKGSGRLFNTLRMAGMWIVFAFIIPGTIHQWISIQMPANLMTTWIDVQRNGRERIFEQPDSTLQQQLLALFPAIGQTAAARDSTRSLLARRYSASALVNQLTKASVQQIEAENQARNRWISLGAWVSPMTFFQNRLNQLAGTHYQDYHAYRRQIQQLIDKRLSIMVHDIWEEKKVDLSVYERYCEEMAKPEQP